MGIGLVIAVLGVGSTLASTITINGGTNQEFGQGVQRTVYCGGNKEITVTPVSSYLNVAEPLPSDSESDSPEAESATPSPSERAGTFYLSAIKVAEVPRECSGVNFVFSVYDQEGGTTPIVISTRDRLEISTPTVYWYDNPEDTTPVPNYGGLLSYDRTTYRPATDQMNLTVLRPVRDKGAFTITFSGADLYPPINKIGRIVVETQNDAILESLGDMLPPLVTPTS